MKLSPERCSNVEWKMTIGATSTAESSSVCLEAAGGTLDVWRSLPHLRAPVTHPMLFRATHPIHVDRSNAVSIVVQLSIERLPKLVRIAEVYQWPVSAAVYITQPDRDIKILADYW